MAKEKKKISQHYISENNVPSRTVFFYGDAIHLISQAHQYLNANPDLGKSHRTMGEHITICIIGVDVIVQIGKPKHQIDICSK